MPWCETCSRFYNPNSLETSGACPSCGAVIATPKAVADATRAPWHFKLLVAAASLYLGWRAVQGIAWVVDHL